MRRYVEERAGHANVAIERADKVLGVNRLKITPGNITIRIGKPIPTIDLPLSERARLTQTLWVRVAELIDYPVPADKRELVEVG